MLYIGNTRYRVYSGRDRVSIESPKKLDVMLKNTLLPSGLELYNYIESNGTQWIDTGVYGYMNHRYELDYLQTGTGSYRMWGVFGQTAWWGYNMSITWSGGRCVRWSSTANGLNLIDNIDTISNTTRHTFIIDKGLIYYDGVDKGKSTGHSDSCIINYSIYLFTVNPANSTPTGNAVAKIYSYKDIDANGVLVRNMLPCTYYGEPGMWDTVENKFYGNEGSGEFTLGNKVVLKEYEYLLSTQGAYIDTGIDNNSNSLRMDLNFRSIQTIGNRYYTGNYANNDGLYFEYISGSDGWQWAWRCTYKQITKAPNTSLPETHSFYIENGTSIFLINGNIIQSNTLNKDGGRIYIGGSKISSSNTIATYWCKITNNGQLIKDFIPCSYNGTPGLWDKVELKFYGNAGSGTFIVGNEIKYYDYLENDGVAYINTNYYPNQSTKLITKKRYSLNSTSIIFGEMDRGFSAGRDAFFISKIQFGFDKLVFSVSAAPEGTEPYLLELSVDGLYRDGVLISKPKSDIATTWSSPREMYLFGINKGNTKTINNTALYYCKIYDNGVLVRDYKPCLYNNQAGLWDSVECKFYGNANSAGVLMVGNNS